MEVALDKNMKILIVDDFSTMRRIIKNLLRDLGFSNTHEADDGVTALPMLKSGDFQFLVTDWNMPGMTGIEAVRSIKKEFPQVLILMQTVFEDDDRVFDSICAGASGYLLKNFLNTKLVDSIKELQYGGSPMSPSIARKVFNRMQQIPQLFKPEEVPDYNLTPREKEVLGCIVDGLSYKMIADKLSISYETVRSHVKKIYEKLHVASLTEVVSKAMKERIV